MLKDDPAFNWAVDLLLSLRIKPEDPPEELNRKLDQAEPALRYFGIDREKFLEVLFPPPMDPAPPGRILERIEEALRRIGYRPEDLKPPPSPPPMSFDEIERTIRTAIQEALAASGQPIPENDDEEEDWDDWDDLYEDEDDPEGGPGDPPKHM